MHIKVQEYAFASSIKNVFQICPPYMPTDAPTTGQFVPSLNKAAGVQTVSYDDVASVVAMAMADPVKFNRGMMGIAPKA